MVTLRRGVSLGLATLGVLALLSIFMVQVEYYRRMPRQSQPQTERVHQYRAMRTPVYVTEHELRIARAAEILAPLGFFMFVLGAYLAGKIHGDSRQ